MEIVGQTIDDAAGECMDKIGRMVGLPYPGGLWMSKIVGTKTGNPCNLSIPLKHKPSLEFSFSGLKTAARYYLQAQGSSHWSFEKKLSTDEIDQLMAYNQDNTLELPPYLMTLYQLLLSSHTVATQHLVDRLKIGIEKYNPKTLGLSGGVSANPHLREQVVNLELPALLAPKALTGDNAVMIGLVK
jgi:N6-L-threonylcarbamoyladenine synthase